MKRGGGDDWRGCLAIYGMGLATGAIWGVVGTVLYGWLR